MHLHRKAFPKYFVLPSLHKALPSATLYYKACTKHFPVLLCTTKLAQSTTQHYLVLQSLHKARPSTTLYYKACTKFFPALLRTTKLAQSTSKTSLYYKACTKHFPVYTTLYRKACAKASFYTKKFLHRETFWYMMTTGIAAPKPDPGAKATNKLKHFLQGFLKGKSSAPKLRKSADKSLSQPWCSHSNTNYDVQLQKTIVLRMQPRQQATLTQPFHCDLQPEI